MIKPFTKLSLGYETPIYASVGPIIVDPVGNILAITSRRFLSSSIASELWERDTGTVVGGRPTFYHASEYSSSRSPSQLIGWFAPAERIECEALELFDFGADVLLLGKDVEIQHAGGVSCGYVSGVNDTANFQLDHAIQVISGLINVHTNDPPESLRGCAGASVLLSGKLLGVVIGYLDEDLLVCPLDRALKECGMGLALAREIEDFNKRLAEEREFDKGIDAVLNSIAQELYPDRPGPGNWRTAFMDWSIASWDDLQNRRSEAFHPYHDFFIDVEPRLDAVQNALIAVAVDRMSDDPIEAAAWRRFVSIAYGCISEAAGGWSDEISSANSGRTASSFKLVSGDKIAA